MATTQTLAKKPDKPETASSTPIEPPAIKSRDMKLNAAGALWREWMIRAPQDMITDDIKNPKIWRTVQGIPACALIRGDHLWFYGHDDSWGAHAIVKYASAKEAKLAILKLFTFAAGADERLFGDENYEVVYDGASYGVRRKVDGVMVATGLGSEGLAMQQLKAQYPQRVA